jgi:hypothetical protein
LDCGLIYNKVRGLSAKCEEIGFSRNYFVDEKPVDQVHISWTKGALGSPWTGTMADLRSSPELGLRPLRGSRSLGKGAGEVEEAALSTFVGSSELGRWGNDGAAERNGWRRSVLGEVGVADSGASKGGRG